LKIEPAEIGSLRRSVNRTAAACDQPAWHVLGTGPSRSASQALRQFPPSLPSRRRCGRLAARHICAPDQFDCVLATQKSRPFGRLFRWRDGSAPIPPAQFHHARPTGAPPCSAPRPPCATGWMLRREPPARRVFMTSAGACFSRVQPKCHTWPDIGRERRVYDPLTKEKPARGPASNWERQIADSPVQ
jgi:hypothetical protein